MRTGTTITYRQLFDVNGFPKLAAGALLARTGGQMWAVALVLFVLQRFHSPALAGVAVFLSAAPGLVVSPLAGALLDRKGRVRLILLDYSVAAMTMLLLAALALGGWISPLVLLVIIALSSLTGPLSASGVRALFPLLIPRDLWDRANAIDSGSQALSAVVGPALAGALVGLIGGPGAFVVTAFVFLGAGAALYGTRDPITAQVAPGTPLLRAAWEGLVYVVRHPTLRGISMCLLTNNLGFGILIVALPVMVLQRYHDGAGTVGLLWAISGAATVGSGLLAGRLAREGSERRFVAIGMTIGALGIAILTIGGSFVAIVVGMVVIGLSAAPADIGLFALRQRRTDPAWFGRAIAVSMSLNWAGSPIGSMLGGPIISYSLTLAFALALGLTALSTLFPFLVIPKEG